MRLADIGLSQGRKAMREAVLLGRALLGHDPATTEDTVLLHEAWDEAGIPNCGVTVHVVYRTAGHTTREHYISLDTVGGGRHYDTSYRPVGRDVRELVVEGGRSPARDRFVRLHQDLAEQLREAREIEAKRGPRLSPVALRRWRFVDNAATVLTHGRPDSSNPLLARVSQGLKPQFLALPPSPRPDAAEAARELDQLAITARRDGNAAGFATCALLLAARVPVAVAAAAAPERRDQQLMRYFTFAALELGVSAWQATYGPAHKALREGYGAAMITAAHDLLASGEQHRDSALDGPFDRDYFSEQLFLAIPYVFASLQLFRFFFESRPDVEVHVRRYATVAEELFVRLQDGLIHQWIDFDDGRLQQERRDILAAQRRDDTLAVGLLLREGELGLRRPRRARGLLLGQVPWPNFKEVPDA